MINIIYIYIYIYIFGDDTARGTHFQLKRCHPRNKVDSTPQKYAQASELPTVIYIYIYIYWGTTTARGRHFQPKRCLRLAAHHTKYAQAPKSPTIIYIVSIALTFSFGFDDPNSASPSSCASVPTRLALGLVVPSQLFSVESNAVFAGTKRR